MATDVSTSLPDIDLPPGCTITVEMTDSLTDITFLNVWGYSPDKESHEPIALLPPALVHEPQASV